MLPRCPGCPGRVAAPRINCGTGPALKVSGLSFRTVFAVPGLARATAGLLEIESPWLLLPDLLPGHSRFTLLVFGRELRCCPGLEVATPWHRAWFSGISGHSKSPYRQRRRRIAPQFGIPVSPGARVYYPGGRVIERFSKIVIGHIAPYHPHVLMSRVSHGVGHKTYRVDKGLFRRLEPNDPARDIQSEWRDRNALHTSNPWSCASRSAALSITGR